MSDDTPVRGESKIEKAKRAGHHLRGTIAETLRGGETHFGADDVALLKFHGTYQQDDRDQRKHREGESTDKAYSFMVRMAIPGGVLTADQYLASDALAAEHANGTLRVTTRQGFQLHGVLKGDLKAAIAKINAALMTTISACGDVQRNVMACPAPLDTPEHVAVRKAADDLALALRPATRAYHEIWLDGEPVVNTAEEEPFYGPQYLPRKFKTAVALANDNSVDVYAQDLGFIAIVEGGQVVGYNVVVGGGLGMTAGKADTVAALGQTLGYVAAEHVVEAARTVVAIYRDHGNRADRRHARIKYLIAEWGMDRFRAEFLARVAFPLEAERVLPAPVYHDYLGWHRQDDGRHFYGLFIQSGRIADRGTAKLMTALREIVATLRPGIVLTAQQNILFTDLPASARGVINDTLARHGVATDDALPAVRRYSLACPALPTCGLAVAESERALPGILDDIAPELESLGLRDAPLTLRMTGCPNGCARPYTADLAFVGRSLGLYNVYVGGRLAGDRMADLFLADVREEDLVPALRPLFARWAAERVGDEGLGDFYQRLAGHGAPRRTLTGKEQATGPSLGFATVA
jgi:sulfite reductase beta subunit-like hemoprotein